jgi:hypothetical protein
MPSFECLYFLENFYLALIEVKRLDLPENAATSEKFHWLKIDRETLKITPLTFRSMDSSSKVEERYFEEGFLKFNPTIGTFIEKYNSALHPLQRKVCQEVPISIEKAITAYFDQLVSA